MRIRIGILHRMTGGVLRERRSLALSPSGVRREVDAPLADRAYQELRERILDLRLLPGQLLVEPELAAELGMSRTPVREALQRLRFEGLVAASTRRGFIVTVPTVESMREVYEITAGIEGQAVKLAAERAGAETIAALERSLADQEAALTSADLGAWMCADRQFHMLLREAAGNRRMLELMHQFDGQLHRARAATIHLRPKPVLSTEEHRAVLDAIKARDAEAARRAHIAHRERADRAMEAVIKDYSALVLRAIAQGPGGTR